MELRHMVDGVYMLDLRWHRLYYRYKKAVSLLTWVFLASAAIYLGTYTWYAVGAMYVKP